MVKNVAAPSVFTVPLTSEDQPIGLNFFFYYYCPCPSWGNSTSICHGESKSFCFWGQLPKRESSSLSRYFHELSVVLGQKVKRHISNETQQ